MKTEEKQERLKDMSEWAVEMRGWLALHRNATSELEARLYRLEGDIERLKNEGGTND
jgi:hypothetical protein